MPVESKPELDKELAEIRREVIESRNLVIKTDNLLKNLHAEVKAVGKRQEDSEKRQWMSTAVAYVLFVALCIGGSVLFVLAKGSAAGQERERLEKQAADATTALEKQKLDTQAMAAASRQAADVYRLMTTLPGDERLRGVDELVKLDQSRLTTLEKQALNDRASQLRKEIGAAALERGRASFHKNEMQPAIADLSRFMAMNPTQEESQEASLLLGAAYSQVKKYDQAIPNLARYASEKKAKQRDYAMLLLSVSYEQTGQLDKAAETAREALAAYPESQFTTALKARLTIAKRLMAGANPETPVAGAQPAAATPTPPPAAPPSPPGQPKLDMKPAVAPPAARPVQ